MSIKKTDLENLLFKAVKLMSFRGHEYGTIFRESLSAPLEFIYRISRATICSIRLYDENLKGHISDNLLFLKRNAGASAFCFSKITPLFHTEKGYNTRNRVLSKLDFGYF